MLLQRDSGNSKTSDGEQTISLLPSECQILHKYMESIEKIEKHYPRDLGECECGFVFEDHRGWAEHLTGLLFKKP